MDLKAKFVPAGPRARDVVLCGTVAAPDDRAINLVAKRTSLGSSKVSISGRKQKGTKELEVPQMRGYYVPWTTDE